MNRLKTKHLSLTLLLISLIVLINSSCSENESDDGNFISIKHTLENGEEIDINLVKDLNQSFHRFENLKEKDKYLINLESTTDVLTLNKKMYEDLSHYWDPYEISLMSSDFNMIQIGDTVYRADQEAQYIRPLTSDEWHLDIYYGLSGLEDLKETALIYENLDNIAKLQEYEFKSPLSKRTYMREVWLSKNLDSRISQDLPSPDGGDSNIKYYYYNDQNGQPYVLRYRNCYNCIVRQAQVRFLCWNRSYRHNGAKSKGGTSTWIYRYDEPYNGWVQLKGSGPIGLYHENGTPNTFSPETRVYVVNSRNQNKPRSNYEVKSTSDVDPSDAWTAYITEIGRYSNNGTWSYHNALMHENNSNTRGHVLIDGYVN